MGDGARTESSSLSGPLDMRLNMPRRILLDGELGGLGRIG